MIVSWYRSLLSPKHTVKVDLMLFYDRHSLTPPLLRKMYTLIDTQPNMKKAQWDSQVYFSQSTSMPECNAAWVEAALGAAGRLAGNESAHDIISVFQREKVPLSLPQCQLIHLLTDAEAATGKSGYLTNSTMGGGSESSFRVALHGPGLGKTSIVEVARSIFDNRGNHTVMHYCNGKIVSMKTDDAKEPRKKKRKTDPNAPKKPQSSYFIYMNSNRDQLKEAVTQNNPAASGKDIVTLVAKLAGEKWKSMSTEDKSPYEQRYVDAKQAYAEQMDAYKGATVAH